tara:strand:+ start:1965 stop:2147 length:183 start_codon:yes stop_codon:yes gene_type:complete
MYDIYDYYDEYSLLNDYIQEEKKERQKPSVERMGTPQETKYNEFVKQIYKSSKKVKNNKK